jgi:ATP-dependent DNA helicase RecG
MFTSKVGRFIPHAESIFAAFKGTGRTNIYDRNDVKDDLLIQFNGVVAFLKKHLNVCSEIRGFDRFDIYEIPLDALREAVVNAIIYRDYSIKGTSIYVRVLDDRVEIENPGGLVEGMAKRDFGKSSMRRNPIIADLFHRMDKVERMGTGINRMRTLMIEAGLKEPVFEMDSFFRAIFYRDPRYSLKTDRLGEKGVEKGVEKLTSTRQEIITHMQQNRTISAKELSILVGISHRKIQENISWLKEKGLIKRIGPDKGGHWEVVKK